MSQIMSLLNLAPDIQEAILFLPKTLRGRDPVCARQVMALAAEEVDWERQRAGWGALGGLMNKDHHRLLFTH
jgi:hypothetical protein